MEINNNSDIIFQSFLKLKEYCERNDFQGWDPYDGLNSPVMRHKILFKFKILRLLWIQFFKRFPINLRPLFLINKGYNPKGIALFLSGYCNLYRLTNRKKYLTLINYLANKLIFLKNDEFSGACWGYNFPWQTRFCLFPINYPSIVTTSFSSYALMDAFDCTKNYNYLETAVSSCDFVINDLKRTINGSGFIFSYTPMTKDCVYNASLLGSRLLSRAFFYTKNFEYIELAKNSIKGVVEDQNYDGSWYYGKQYSQRWIDSFHTGFVLECLSEYQNYSNDLTFIKKIEIGLNYYINSFFTNKGEAKYYNNCTYPLDIHSISVLFSTLYKLGLLKKYSSLANNCLIYAIKNFQDKFKGYFYYQKYRCYTNKISYIRWSQAWMFYALTLYLSED